MSNMSTLLRFLLLCVPQVLSKYAALASLVATMRNMLDSCQMPSRGVS